MRLSIGRADAKSSIAEVFFDFATALREKSAADDGVLHYARIARFLRPNHIDALLLTADLLKNLGQYDLAIQELQDVPADNPRLSCRRTEPGRCAMPAGRNRPSKSYNS